MIFPLVLIGKGFFIALFSPVLRFMAVLGLGGVFAYGGAWTAKKGLAWGGFSNGRLSLAMGLFLIHVIDDFIKLFGVNV